MDAALVMHMGVVLVSVYLSSSFPCRHTGRVRKAALT